MELFNRLKKDKQFRRTIVFVIIGILFLMNIQKTGTQATWTPQSECDKYVTLGLVNDVNACVAAGCYIKLDSLTENFATGCLSCVPDTKYTTNMNGCCSGSADYTGKNLMGDYTYICKTSDTGTCKPWQRTISQMVNNLIFKQNPMDCAPASWLGVGAIAFLILMVI
jgi:hypothetical protein